MLRQEDLKQKDQEILFNIESLNITDTGHIYMDANVLILNEQSEKEATM